MKYYRTLLSGPTVGGTRDPDILHGSAAGTVFKYDADGSWGGAWSQNAGDPGHLGTLEMFSIDGYLRSNDIYVGVASAHNKLVMDDGHLALFLDDPFSANGGMARLQNIQEIVAGDGGQIVDLTSQTYSYGNVSILGGAGNDILMSSAGKDTLNGLDGNDYLWGGTGADTLAGGKGTDRVFGGEGNDVVRGGQSNDQAWGGLGDDSVYGDTGNDSIAGEDGDDGIFGGDGNDTVLGNSGNDILAGGKGFDILSGGAGNDTLSGNTSNDTLDGGSGSDTLNGDEGNDLVRGDDGNDFIQGWSGNDTVVGGDGQDTLLGNKGNDTLTGGNGNDSFVWLANENYVSETKTRFTDHITDFAAGDKLDFSSLIKAAAAGDATQFVKFTDQVGGTMVLVASSATSDFHATVLLDGVHGLDVHQAQTDGWLLI